MCRSKHAANVILDVGITGLDPTGLCVNVGKKVSRTADMRLQSKDGAIWIPAQLLEIVPYQTVKSQLPPALISAMNVFLTPASLKVAICSGDNVTPAGGPLMMLDV